MTSAISVASHAKSAGCWRVRSCRRRISLRRRDGQTTPAGATSLAQSHLNTRVSNRSSSSSKPPRGGALARLSRCRRYRSGRTPSGSSTRGSRVGSVSRNRPSDAYGDGEPEPLGFAPGQAEHGASTRQDDPDCGDGAAVTPIARMIAASSSGVRAGRWTLYASRHRGAGGSQACDSMMPQRSHL